MGGKLVPALKNFFIISLPAVLLLLLLLEGVFRWIIPASNPPDLYFDPAGKMIRYDNRTQTDGLVTSGKWAQVQARWHINNYGWNSALDYQPERDSTKQRIAVIGDSYIAALIVDVNANFMALMQKQLGDGYEIYSFGKSGIPASHYLHINRYVLHNFNPDCIIVHFVHNDFVESLHDYEVHPECLQLSLEAESVREIAPAGLKLADGQGLKKSALFRYLYYNLNIYRLNQNIMFKRRPVYNANVDVQVMQKYRADLERVMHYIISTLQRETAGKRLLLMMDGPRYDIYADNLAGSNIIWINQLFDRICRENGVEFLDLTDAFARDYKIHQRRFNWDWDAHWNDYGHEVVATAVLDYLQQRP